MILTSAMCDNIVDIKSRFTDIEFTNTPNKVYRVYCNNTIEYNRLMKEKIYPFIKIINFNEENFIGYDENSGNIIL